jgi:hypothetical protein
LRSSADLVVGALALLEPFCLHQAREGTLTPKLLILLGTRK